MIMQFSSNSSSLLLLRAAPGNLAAVEPSSTIGSSSTRPWRTTEDFDGRRRNQSDNCHSWQPATRRQFNWPLTRSDASFGRPLCRFGASHNGRAIRFMTSRVALSLLPAPPPSMGERKLSPSNQASRPLTLGELSSIARVEQRVESIYYCQFLTPVVTPILLAALFSSALGYVKLNLNDRELACALWRAPSQWSQREASEFIFHPSCSLTRANE